MTQIIELLNKDVKSAIMKILQPIRVNTLERNVKVGCFCKEIEVINEDQTKF